nr:ATP-dependent helicase HrpB [Motilibacter aurantiacus]
MPDPRAVPQSALPVRSALAGLARALEGGSAVLVAPPGTGKTTLVPLWLADAVAGRVVVAEPRRVAARAAARRMASLLGEQVGGRVGYTVRGDRRASAATRVEVVTTGVLVQRLQRDPELPGVDAVVLDECHERHLDTDLALAFCIDVRAALRPELLLLATSATAEAGRLARVLGDGPPAPVVTARGALHPIEVVWAPPPAPVTPPYGLRVDPRLLDAVAATILRALAEDEGDVLAFLPGVAEIRSVAGRLGALAGVDVVALHGRLPAAEQDAVLRPGPRRRVVLATSVAESSLTVPGVRVVVDSGLARVPRLDPARGLGSLVTVRASRAAAEQRAGRAGREAPGRAYRCWSEADQARLPAQPEPEVAGADLTGFALELARWGAPGGAGLALLDQPPAGAFESALEALRALGAIDSHGRATPRGRRLGAVGAGPRLARALLDGAPLVGRRAAAEVVALLAEPGGQDGDDLLAALSRLRAGRPGPSRDDSAAWRQEARRLEALVDADAAPPAPVPPDLAAGLVVGLAFPERLARVREPGGTAYLMTGGTAVELGPGTALHGAEWLAVAVADRAPGRSAARVRAAVPVDEATAQEAAPGLLAAEERVAWTGGDVEAVRVERLGAVVLAERRLDAPDPALVRAALQEGLRREGLALLPWSAEATALRQRLAFLRGALGEPWPDVADAALLDRVDEWLGPELATARRRADLARVGLAAALRRMLPWPAAARLDELAPERLEVPSGARRRVDYSEPAAPVLAVPVQEAFGWLEGPVLAGGACPVVLHLVSPAGRPVAVTRDLASFWRQGYPQVRAELRGRYPKHAWPEDPLSAPPRRRR